MANGMQYMGVSVSPSEVRLLKFAQDCPEVAALPEHQHLERASVLKRDIYRVADWKAANG